MIFFILPIYNEGKSLESLLRKIQKEMTSLNEKYKVIIVNDGSRDGTKKIVEALHDQLPLEVIEHEMNRGLWETVRDGFELAARISQPDDIFIRMDADDTHDPKYVPAMVRKIAEGFDVVIASRFQKGGGAQGLNFYRTFISRAANIIMKIFFPIPKIWEYSCGYRAYRANIIQNAIKIFGNSFIDLKGVGFTCTLEKLIKMRMMGARITEIPFILRYDQKLSQSKLVSSITTIGYLVLIAKYIYPWGETGKQWQKMIRDLNIQK